MKEIPQARMNEGLKRKKPLTRGFRGTTFQQNVHNHTKFWAFEPQIVPVRFDSMDFV
jgi:hypothetical protein